MKRSWQTSVVAIYRRPFRRGISFLYLLSTSFCGTLGSAERLRPSLPSIVSAVWVPLASNPGLTLSPDSAGDSSPSSRLRYCFSPIRFQGSGFLLPQPSSWNPQLRDSPPWAACQPATKYFQKCSIYCTLFTTALQRRCTDHQSQRYLLSGSRCAFHLLCDLGPVP